MKRFFLSILIFTVAVSAQSKDPDKILDAVKNNFNKINDYTVDVSIKVDVSFLKVPDTKAKIYYKEPDKVQIKSTGFALLPKGALDISPTSLLKGKYTAFFDRVEDYEGVKAAVIKAIPLGESEDVILSTFWIDAQKERIMKVEISTKLNGTFTIELKYSGEINFPQLPSSLMFSFDVSKLNIPKRFSGGTDKGGNENYKPNPGKVYINYSNYVVNKGIPDSVFVKPNESFKRKR